MPVIIQGTVGGTTILISTWYLLHLEGARHLSMRFLVRTAGADVPQSTNYEDLLPKRCQRAKGDNILRRDNLNGRPHPAYVGFEIIEFLGRGLRSIDNLSYSFGDRFRRLGHAHSSVQHFREANI